MHSAQPPDDKPTVQLIGAQQQSVAVRDNEKEASTAIVPIDPVQSDEPTWLIHIAKAIEQGHRCVVLTEDQQAGYKVWQTLKQPYQALTEQGVGLYATEPLRDSDNRIVVCPSEQAVRWELTADGELQLVDANGSTVATGPASAELGSVAEDLATWSPDDNLVTTADGDTIEYASQEVCRQDWAPLQRPHMPVQQQYLSDVDLVAYGDADISLCEYTPDWFGNSSKAKTADQAMAAFVGQSLITQTDGAVPRQEFVSAFANWYRGLTGESPPSRLHISRSLPGEIATKMRFDDGDRRRYLSGVAWRLPSEALCR